MLQLVVNYRPVNDEVLDRAREVLAREIAPRAQIIDQDPAALGTALDALAAEGLLALKRPREYGGPAVGEAVFRAFQEEVARASGALAFLQTQHQSAVSMIARSENEDLKRRYLPSMADGAKRMGIGFSQLRRSGRPMMVAEPVEAGFRLRGEVPWVTGWSFYPEFLVGATLPDGRALFGIVPLSAEAGVAISPPMRLCAMESAMTVSVRFEGFVLHHDNVAFVREANWIRNNDQVNIALQGYFALGCAQAGLDVLAGNAGTRGYPFLHDTLTCLQEELHACRAATLAAQKDASEETTDDRLRVRAWAIDLAVRCAHAAIASSGGAANSIDHPAQRIYRETLVYTVSAQTPQIMAASLARITDRGLRG